MAGCNARRVLQSQRLADARKEREHGTVQTGYAFKLDGGSAVLVPNGSGPFASGQLDIQLDKEGQSDPWTGTLKLQLNKNPDQNLDPEMFNITDAYGLLAAGLTVRKVPGAGDVIEEYGAKVFEGTDPVPEPASMLLLGTGLIGLAGVVRRRLGKK